MTPSCLGWIHVLCTFCVPSIPEEWEVALQSLASLGPWGSPQFCNPSQPPFCSIWHENQVYYRCQHLLELLSGIPIFRALTDWFCWQGSSLSVVVVSVRWLSRHICLHIVDSYFLAVEQKPQMADKASNTCCLALKLADTWCQAASFPCLVAGAIILKDSQLQKGLPRIPHKVVLDFQGWEQKLQGSEIKRQYHHSQIWGVGVGVKPPLMGGAVATSPRTTYRGLEKLPPSVKILCKCPAELPSTVKFNPGCLTVSLATWGEWNTIQNDLHCGTMVP